MCLLSVRCRQLCAILGLLLFISYLPTPRAAAQTTSGTLVGTVYKPTGEPLGGAKVTAINELNANQRSTVTAPDGSYRIPFMPPGHYTIRASNVGFTDSQITGFPIPLNSTTNLVPPITLGAIGGQPVVPVGAGGQTVSSTAMTEGEGRAAIINTNDATRRGNFTLLQVQSLPLGGTTDTRTFDELALLVAGVAPAPYVPGVRGPGVGFGIGTAGQFSVNGLRARSNNFTVDGSDNNDPDVGVRRQGFVSLVPQSIESIQEFQLSTLLWDAELGRNVGSQVNAVSRSGGNEFHGQLYGYFTDSKLNARNFFDYTGGDSKGKNPYTRVQTGIVFGGPIVKDRSQFFFSYEHQQIDAAIEEQFSTPPASARRFLNLPDFAVLRPFPTATPDLGFDTLGTGTTPLGANILSFYPLPNDAGGPYGLTNYSEVLPASGSGDIFSIKVTHQVNQDNILNARYNFTDDQRILPSVNRAIRSTINSNTRTQNLSLIYDTGLSATLFNQARFSYGRTTLAFPEFPTSPFLFQSSSVVNITTPGGTVGFDSRTFPIGELQIEPFSPVGVDVYTFPQGRTSNTFQFADSVSWTRGTHSVKFGADIRREHLDSFQDRNYRPLVVFGDGVQAFGLLKLSGDPNKPFDFQDLSSLVPLPGIQIATFGTPSSVFQVITKGPPDSSIKLRFTEYNFYINDSWRVRPNFMLDYGVRYEYNTVPREADDKIENGLTLKDLPTPGRSRVDSPLFTFAFNEAVRELQGFLQGRTKIYDNDTNNFGPHVGFAWDPRSDGKMSIRGGYGVYFDAILGAVVSQSRNQFPAETPINVNPSFVGANVFDLFNPSTLAFRDARGNPIVFLVKPGSVNQFGGTNDDFVAQIGALFAQNFGTGGLAVTLPAKDLATPYVQQWHLTFEREMFNDYAFSVAYVGTKGTKLTRLTTPNGGLNVTPFLPIVVAAPGTPYQQGPPLVVADRILSLIRPRPSPLLGAIQIFENSAASSYHALQVEVRKRYSHGFTFTTAYTWSHAIDDVSDVFPIAGAPVVAEDSFNLRLERGDANYDIRHRFAASAIYDLPFYRDAKDARIGSAPWLLSGFRISGIFQGHTGQPFTVNLPFDLNLDGNLTDRPISDDKITRINDHGPVRLQLDPNAQISDFVRFLFQFPSTGGLILQGSDGNVGRNTFRADGFVDLDVVVNKNFRFTETQNLEFRTEVFNLLNRANFGIPIRSLFNFGFGSAVETANPARTIQFAVKYSF